MFVMSTYFKAKTIHWFFSLGLFCYKMIDYFLNTIIFVFCFKKKTNKILKTLKWCCVFTEHWTVVIELEIYFYFSFMPIDYNIKLKKKNCRQYIITEKRTSVNGAHKKCVGSWCYKEKLELDYKEVQSPLKILTNCMQNRWCSLAILK